jgi:hypothetical protein
MPATVIRLASFRAERGRQHPGDVAVGSEIAERPFRNDLASVALSPRQIAHRRTMLDYARQLRMTTVSPISRNASRSRSLASASWTRSIGSIKGSLLNWND